MLQYNYYISSILQYYCDIICYMGYLNITVEYFIIYIIIHCDLLLILCIEKQ